MEARGNECLYRIALNFGEFTFTEIDMSITRVMVVTIKKLEV